MQFWLLFQMRLVPSDSRALIYTTSKWYWRHLKHIFTRGLVSLILNTDQPLLNDKKLLIPSMDSPSSMVSMIKKSRSDLLRFSRKLEFIGEQSYKKKLKFSLFPYFTSNLWCLYLLNGLFKRAEILGIFLTIVGLSTVKIWAKSERSIEQGWSWLTCNDSYGKIMKKFWCEPMKMAVQ